MCNNSFKKVEDMLKEYNNIKCKILNLKIDLDIIKNEVTGIKAIDYSKEYVSNSNVGSIVESQVIHREKEKEILKIETEINRLEGKIRKIDNSISTLNELEQDIVREIYFKNNKAYMAARKLNVSESTVFKMKKSILNKLIKIITF